jgi:toxin ParE1/3/4
MVKVNKRPIVIQDLIEQATFIAEGDLDASDRFLEAAEETFNLLGTMPAIGRFSRFTQPNLVDIRQFPIKGFQNFLVFYRISDEGVDVLRVLHGSRELDAVLDEDDS